MAKTFRSKSRILRLPRSILDQVNIMLIEVGEGRKTYEEIAGWVKEQGYQASKSAIQRYARWVSALEKVKLVGEQAKAIIDQAGHDPLKIEEATAKLGAVIMMEVFQEAMSGDRIDVQHIGHLMGDFAKLQQSSVSRERLKADFVKKLEKAVESAPDKDKKMMPEEVLKFIKDKVYGLGA
ncbi:MAG TPA: phage protein Gp27 family protein [Desulfatiglandales bacterium]|nr:phage protein Gp27 family protein [Desulfatiglandales bacterium]